MRFDVETCRSHFPALNRMVDGKPLAYLDGPAGSQVPTSVVSAIASHLLHHNANHGGMFITSRENDAIVDRAREAVADLLGAPDADCIAFGANMTTLTFALSRALATTWQAGDEVIVSSLDHDANVSPWVRVAADRGVIVKRIPIHREDCTLDLDAYRALLSPRVKLVAFGAVSNAVGTRNPVREMTALAHAVGAKVFVDAVHHVPHLVTDVLAWDCDFCAASAYKFFGPHVGILYGKRELLETLPAYKVRACAETLPDRWMTGTQNFAAIAGVGAAVEYLQSLGTGTSRREQLTTAFAAIESHERTLSKHGIDRLTSIPGVQLFGIRDDVSRRVPTFGFLHRNHTPQAVATTLAAAGICVWHGNFYALPLTESLGLEPNGMIRAGLMHYGTVGEIDRLATALLHLDPG